MGVVQFQTPVGLVWGSTGGSMEPTGPFVPKARRRPVQPEMLMTMRMGPAICVATWGFATLEHLPSLFF